MASVRAKFRVLERTETYDKSRTYTLRPVHRASGKTDPENRAFWEATPSGEVTLAVWADDDPFQFELGAYYYADFTESEGGRWAVSEITINDGSRHVTLNKRWECEPFRHGTIKLGINNPRAYERFSVPQRFEVAFSFAEASGD